MKPTHRVAAAAVLFIMLTVLSGSMPQDARVDEATIARIREEGFQRSRVMDIAGYICDVLGARLTLSEDMKRAQAWVRDKMTEIGLANVALEPFMDYGVAWDNEYVSLHMIEPDYQPMVGYPLAHTPGTPGRIACPAVFAELRTRADLEKHRGKLSGAAVLATPPAPIDMDALTRGVARRSDEELRALEAAVIPVPQRPAAKPAPRNPDLLSAEEKIAFYRSEGAAIVFQCDSGWPGAVRGFARPGTKEDRWSRDASLAGPPIVAVTPEHYNRMVRILERGIPVRIEAEVRNRLGATVEQAVNVLGEIPGTDLAGEVVMIGAHFDSWHASPNASDNASGCAVMLEAARILKAIGARPRRTIRVALWAGEEQGLHGSREYVLRHFGDPADPAHPVTPAYEKFSCYFNQDYGAGQFRGIHLQGNEHARRLLAAWLAPFRDLGLTAVSIQSVGSTDHIPFDQAGLPGFQFIQDRLGGTGGHTNLDFFEGLRADDLMKNAVVTAAFAWHAATCDERMPRKIRR